MVFRWLQVNCENVPELKVARAQVGSLGEWKRNKRWRPNDFVGFQPLHFTWQPCCLKMLHLAALRK
jgi:hypothetical protein